jgi:N-acetylneuraminic acid mutarotase
LLDNFVYSFGGLSQGKQTDNFFRININDWKVEFLNIQKPSRRSGHSLTGYNNTLYLFGGFDKKNYYNDFWLFHPLTCKWKQISHSYKSN